MSANSNMDKRQKIREQMRQFYGDPNAAGNSAHRRAQDGARRNTGVAPEMDLDSEFFNVTKYTTELLRKETLKGLVETDTELLRSVRKLDGELQELVYRNYAKFISATDTIREMRDNVSQMDTKLQALSSNVTKIDEVSKGISDKLQEHHGRIENTITTNRMLKKIQFLVELPTTMRQLLDRQEYGVCVKYWVAGDGFLTKHTTLQSIAKIQTECRGLAKELYAKMEQAMCAVSLDDPEAMDSIRGYVENLRLMRATSLYTREEQQREEGSTTFDEAILKVLMKSVSDSFASGVAAAQRDIKSALLIPGNLLATDVAQRGGVLSQVRLREALAQLKSTCALLAVNSERVYSLLNKLDGSKVAMRVAQEVQPVLIDLLTPISKQLAELAVAVFASICDEGLMALDTPEAVSTALQAAVASLMRQAKHTAVTLKTLSANYLDTIHSHQSHAYSSMVDQTLAETLTTVAGALKEKAWQQPDSAAVAAMVGSHVEAGQTSTATLAAASTSQGGNNSFIGASKAADLQVQRTAFAASRWVYASTAATLARECITQLVQGDALSANRSGEVVEALEEAAQLLLHRGVVLVGQLEAKAIAEAGFGNAANAVDPTLPVTQGGGVHPLLMALVRFDWPKLAAVLEALPPAIPTDPKVVEAAAMRGAGNGDAASSIMGKSNLASYTGRMFTPSSTGRSSGPRSTASPSGGGNGGKPLVRYTRREDVVLQSSVDRIFSVGGGSALHTFPRDGRPGTVMSAVVIYVLAALVAYVRATACARPYGQNAFQRLQVNATYLVRALLAPHKGTAPRQWIKVWNDAVQRTVQQQLDECCCCAYERYEAKVPLSNAALEKIVEEAATAEVVLPFATVPAAAPVVSLSHNASLSAGPVQSLPAGQEPKLSPPQSAPVSVPKPTSAPATAPPPAASQAVAPAVTKPSAVADASVAGSKVPQRLPVPTMSSSQPSVSKPTVTAPAPAGPKPTVAATTAPTPASVRSQPQRPSLPTSDAAFRMDDDEELPM